MKRRTFLQLVPFAAIGLTACGHSGSTTAEKHSLSLSSDAASVETDQNTDDMDEDYEESGLTLEEAQYYSKTYNCAYFIRRASDERFYPVAVPLVAYEWSKDYTTDCVFIDSGCYRKYASMGSFKFSLSEGDELVFISEDFSTPDTVKLYPVTDSVETFPFAINYHNGTNVYPDGSYDFTSLCEYRYDLYDQLVTSSNKSFIQNHHAYREHLFSDYDPSLASDATELRNFDGPLTATLLNDSGDAGDMPTTEINHDGQYNMGIFLPNGEQSTAFDDFDPSSAKAQAEIGYYEGSTYNSFVLSADSLALGYSADYAYQASTALTKDGYSVVDLSDIFSYYELPEQPVQFVIDCNYSRFEVDGIPFFAFIAVHP